MSPFPHPYFFRLQDLLLSIGIQHFEIKSGFYSGIIRKQDGEDTVLLIRIRAQAATEVYAILHRRIALQVGNRHTLVLKNILQFHLLNARIERSVVDIEGRGKISLVLGRQHDLPALRKILSILNRDLDG